MVTVKGKQLEIKSRFNSNVLLFRVRTPVIKMYMSFRRGAPVISMSSHAITRKHSSRMPTAHLPTIHGVAPQDVISKGVGTPCTYPSSGRDLVPEIPTHPRGQTDTYEIITFSKLRWRAVNMYLLFRSSTPVIEMYVLLRMSTPTIGMHLLFRVGASVIY